MKKTILVLSIILAFIASPSNGKTKYFNPKNIDKIVRTMTLEEKARMVVGGSVILSRPDNDMADYYTRFVTPGTKITIPLPATYTRYIKRLGIPPTCVCDGPCGMHFTYPVLDKGYAVTSFPITTAYASSWNIPLVTEAAEALSNECLAYGIDVVLGPAMNIQRNPLCGRNFEYVSEDPVVSGKIAAAFTKGLQDNGIGVSLKHFAANNQETNRGAVDARISERAIREIYLKGYEITVKEAQPWTIMTSYNKLNGTTTSESKDLLGTVARDEWGFDGIYMTDWGGGRNAARQIAAGNDLLMPGTDQQVGDIIAAVKEGTLSMADLDACVRRVLQYVAKSNNFKMQGKEYSMEADLKANAAASLKLALESMVLMKNEAGTLPLRKGSDVALFGVASYDTYAGGTGAAGVVTDYVVSVNEGLVNEGMSLNQELSDFYTRYVEEDKASQPATFGPLAAPVVARENLLDMGVIRRAAESSDVAVFTVGRTAGEGSDRRLVKGDWYFSDTENQLLSMVAAAFHAKGKKVVVILNSGGVMETTSWAGKVDAILNAWQGGLEVGNAVAKLLTGSETPSGKLAVTYPLDYMDIPSSWNFPYDYEAPKPDIDFSMSLEDVKKAREQNTFVMDQDDARKAEEEMKGRKNVAYTNYEEDIYVGYRYFVTSKVPVSFPFGFGLSYTTFEYSNPSVERTADGWKASITVKNTGKVAGKESVQLYVAAPQTIEKPAYELKAFAKTATLAPGDAETLTMTFSDYDLASFDESRSAWVTAPGAYKALFAASSEDIRQTAPFTVASELVEKVHDVLAPEFKMDRLSLK